MTLVEQLINFAKICFINNLNHPALGHGHCFSNFFLGPSQQAQADDGAVPVGFLSVLIGAFDLTPYLYKLNFTSNLLCYKVYFTAD